MNLQKPNDMPNAISTTSETVIAYHQLSKHHMNAYAKGPDTIDWSAQPDAFRHYSDATTIALPFIKESMQVSYDELFLNSITPQPLNMSTLAGLFELSMGLSAWKQYGTDRWALRCNPSSGNLHPTEAYALVNNIENIPDGIHHYCSDEHLLEQRCLISSEVQNNSESETLNNTNSLFICLSSIHWREAWKYGERAFRYSQLDIGHAIAALRYAASCYGWSIELQFQFNSEELETLFGFNRIDDYIHNEKECIEVLVKINTLGSENNTVDKNTIPDSYIKNIQTHHFSGKANTLDRKHLYNWEIIDVIDYATRNPGEVKQSSNTNPTSCRAKPIPEFKPSSIDAAATIIRQRRSAQHYDANTLMPQNIFYQLMDKLLVRNQTVPFDVLSWQARIHPVIFIHRVEGIPKGLYALPRHADAFDLLKSEMRDDFLWQTPDNCPAHIPLYKLVLANCQNAARTLFCQQQIAADSAFSIGMLAEFRQTIMDKPWRYRELYWEAGILGQAMYLEAEAQNFRATGIGCFYDDSFHETLGLKSDTLQSLYHFTVGTPIVDNRLISLSAYGHIKR